MTVPARCPKCCQVQSVKVLEPAWVICSECSYKFTFVLDSVQKKAWLETLEGQKFQQQYQEQQRLWQSYGQETKQPEPPRKQERVQQKEPEEPESVRLAKNPTGGVYLIKSGQHFKIGKANDFEQRIKQVKLQLPEKAVEVHRIYTDDPLGIESYWHKRFKEKRKNGEWFELAEEDVEIFKARTRM